MLALALNGLVSYLHVVRWLLWDKPNQQCLHDKYAQTVVVRVRHG